MNDRESDSGIASGLPVPSVARGRRTRGGMPPASLPVDLTRLVMVNRVLRARLGDAISFSNPLSRDAGRASSRSRPSSRRVLVSSAWSKPGAHPHYGGAPSYGPRDPVESIPAWYSVSGPSPARRAWDVSERVADLSRCENVVPRRAYVPGPWQA